MGDLQCEPLSSQDTLAVTWSRPSQSAESVLLYEVIVKQYEQPGDRDTLTIVDLGSPFNQKVVIEQELKVSVTELGE